MLDLLVSQFQANSILELTALNFAIAFTFEIKLSEGNTCNGEIIIVTSATLWTKVGILSWA